MSCRMSMHTYLKFDWFSNAEDLGQSRQSRDKLNLSLTAHTDKAEISFLPILYGNDVIMYCPQLRLTYIPPSSMARFISATMRPKMSRYSESFLNTASRKAGLPKKPNTWSIRPSDLSGGPWIANGIGASFLLQVAQSDYRPLSQSSPVRNINSPDDSSDDTSRKNTSGNDGNNMSGVEVLEDMTSLAVVSSHGVVTTMEVGPGLVLVALVCPPTGIVVKATPLLVAPRNPVYEALLYPLPDVPLLYSYRVSSSKDKQAPHALFDHKLYSKVCFDPPYSGVFDVALHISNTVPKRSDGLFSLVVTRGLCPVGAFAGTQSTNELNTEHLFHYHLTTKTTTIGDPAKISGKHIYTIPYLLASTGEQLVLHCLVWSRREPRSQLIISSTNGISFKSRVPNSSLRTFNYLGQGFVTEQTGIIEIAYVGSPRADCSNMDHTVCTREYRLHWLNDLRQYCRIADDRKIPKYMCKELHQNIHVCPLILVGPVLVPEAVSVSYSSKLILNDGEGKNLSTLDRDLNLDFLVISSLVYYESSVLVHVATEGYEHRCIKPEVLGLIPVPGWYQRMSKPEGRRLKELVYLWINAGVIA
uniref:Uncharacterized protein n=1 Tax=Timema shepardi TaxID=629360 RepID=A0A7R9AWI9_TIMSH|nr:unnamed protein product [Timema shepardi]